MEEPVFRLPHHNTDALDFTIVGVLIQEGHSVSFENRKLVLKENKKKKTNQASTSMALLEEPTPQAKKLC